MDRAPPPPLAPGQSPSRYMMYRNEAVAAGAAPEHAATPGMFPPPHPSMMPHAAMVPPPPPHAAAAAAAMYAHPSSAAAAGFSLPMHSSGAPNGSYQMLPLNAAGGAYPFVDAQSIPMLMHMPPPPSHMAMASPSYGLASSQHAPPSMMDARADALSESWNAFSSHHTDNPEPATAAAAVTAASSTNMDDLLALSRQAQLEADGGPNANVFVCPHCEKRYVGKHARSIWRRHLQDKHAIPLSVQPRRTRWDRDVNRPRNAAERRERMLESKRRWARKKREQERRAAAASRSGSVVTKSDTATNASATPPPSEPDESDSLETSAGAEPAVKVEPAAVAKAAPLPAMPPKRTALAPFDTNIPMSMRRVEAKSPSTLEGGKMFMPSPLQSTPMRSAFANPSLLFGGASPSDLRSTAPDSARRPMPFPPLSHTKRTPFSRIEPSPRMFGSSLHAQAQLSAQRHHGGSGSAYDAPASPSVRSFRPPRAGGDQFSSPQHLNLTQSLGLAPHSASKGAPDGGFSSMYAPSMSMTPMGANATPFGRMPLGLTPTINGLMRYANGGGSADVSGNGLLGGDLSGYMLGIPSLDSPHILRSSVRRTPRRTAAVTSSFHSSSERDDDDELENDGEMRIISPSLRQRVRGQAKLPMSNHDTPSKVGSPLRGVHDKSLGKRTPQHISQLR